MRRLYLAVMFLFSIFSCQAETHLAKEDLNITGVYARATIPGQYNSAVYFLLENHSGISHAVIKASSPVAEKTQLHISVIKQGLATMQPLDKITVKPHQFTLLKPGGMHVMLIGLKDKLQPGDNIPLTLTFEDNTTVTLNVPVRRI